MEKEAVIVVDGSRVRQRIEAVSRTEKASSISVPRKVSKKELCRYFIQGNNTNYVDENMLRKVMSKKFAFSPYAFLFGPYYFAYRKCYKDILYCFVLGDINAIFFYTVYREKAIQAIKTAIEEGADEAAIARLRKKGGVNPFGPLLVFLVGPTILLVCFLIAFGVSHIVLALQA